MREAYDFICSIGELIDKLSIENIKCFHANMEILQMRKWDEEADTPPCHAPGISENERKARTAGEQRVRLRDEINRRLAEAIARGELGQANEVRTYR